MEKNLKERLITEISTLNKNYSATEEFYNLFKKNWFKEFIISDLNNSDKVDILTYAQPILMKIKKLAKTRKEKKFFNFVAERKYHDAVKLGNILAYEYPEKREYIKSLIKKRDIYLLSPKLEIEMGGLGHTVRHRANYFEKQGYNVKIVNVGPIKNYKYILDYYHDSNRLSSNIPFYNIYEYFSKKYTFGEPIKNLDQRILDSKENLLEFNNVNIEKIFNDDNSMTLNYYFDEKIIKEIYIDETLIYKEDDEFEKYFTPDGFNYLNIDKNSKKVFLNDRLSNTTIEFKSLIRFLYHFLNEICLQSSQKPFIICDSTGHWYNMNGVSLKHAFKIGSNHGNPFIDFDSSKDLNPKVNHFKKIHLLDKVVVLTNETKEDLISRVDSNKLAVIPNFVLDEYLNYENVEKDLNSISVFSRIAPQKQLSHILKAFKIVSEKKDIKLKIYGGTSADIEKFEMNQLKSQVKELGLEDKVEFKGYSQNVAPLMRKNLFTLLSSKMEGLPMSIIESMASSSPVISYDVKYGPKDIITNNVDGILIDYGDIEGLSKAMIHLLDNPEKAIEMGKNAKEKIEKHYSMDVVGKMWEDLFIDIFIEKEVNEYFDSITIKNRYNKSINDNKKLKREIKVLKNELTELKDTKTDQNTSSLKKLKKFLTK